MLIDTKLIKVMCQSTTSFYIIQSKYFIIQEINHQFLVKSIKWYNYRVAPSTYFSLSICMDMKKV